jgi:hypothetical protein
MHIKTKNGIKRKFVNMFGAFGYLAITIQWLWAIALYLNVIKDVLIANTPKGARPVQQVVTSTSNTPLNPIVYILGILITVMAVGMIIYFLVKAPKAIVKTASKVVSDTAESVVPVVLHIQHKKDTQINHTKVNRHVRLLIKCFLLIIPLIAAFISELTQTPLYSSEMTTYSSLILAGLSIVLFGIQYAMAQLLHVKRSNLT